MRLIIALAAMLAAATQAAGQTMAELHDAVTAGDLARVGVLINSGASVDEKTTPAKRRSSDRSMSAVIPSMT
jgi:hypothetical protein